MQFLRTGARCRSKIGTDRSEQKLSAAPKPDPNSVLPTGSQILIRGQVASMSSAYTGLGVGIIFAIALVYFLMVVNFQSWLDPFIIIMALPGALAGIVLMLFITDTPLSVPGVDGRDHEHRCRHG